MIKLKDKIKKIINESKKIFILIPFKKKNIEEDFVKLSNKSHQLSKTFKFEARNDYFANGIAFLLFLKKKAKKSVLILA